MPEESQEFEEHPYFGFIIDVASASRCTACRMWLLGLLHRGCVHQRASRTQCSHSQKRGSTWMMQCSKHGEFGQFV